MRTIKFTRSKEHTFAKEVKKRVNNYFKENNLDKYGNWKVKVKALVWHLAYFAPYFILLLTNAPIYAIVLLAILMGVAKCGIGLNTMHDANHGTFSRKQWINKLASASLVPMGGNPVSWKIQHNVLHHSFTNIHEHDEDIAPRYVMRFNPSDKRRWFHRFQHIYSPIFYALMTLVWALHKDFVQLRRYHKMSLIEGQSSTYRKELWKTIGIKAFYVGYVVVIPALFGNFTLGEWFLWFLTMHFTAGLLLACIFQSAHVVEDTDKPEAPESGMMEDEWMIHQMKTTANFATKSRWFSWFAGGLNFQVEHHLFPNISHIHYPAISKIVKKCAMDFNVPYYDSPTFYSAVKSHFTALRDLGKKSPVIK